MAEHPNVARIKAVYAAAATGDTAALNDLFAEDLLWHAGGRLPQAGDYRGREAVFGFLGKLRELAGIRPASTSMRSLRTTSTASHW